MRIERIQSGFKLAEGTAFTYKPQEVFALPRIREHELNLDTLNLVQNDERKRLEEELEKLNQAADLFNKKIRFEIHEDTNRIMVQILHAETGDILSELPPKKILDLLASMEEMIGVLVDKRA